MRLFISNQTPCRQVEIIPAQVLFSFSPERDESKQAFHKAGFESVKKAAEQPILSYISLKKCK
jgi:hypothetical protein